jgi:hypothetical protein
MDIKINNETVKIDKNDLPLINNNKWRVQEMMPGYKYVVAYIKGEEILLHRLLKKCGPGKVVDHINGNSLDNRRSNLRICSQAENMMNKNKYKNNKSGYKGVWFHKNKKRWEVQIRIGGKKIYLGVVNSPEMGAIIYNSAAKEYFGEFARLNKI